MGVGRVCAAAPTRLLRSGAREGSMVRVTLLARGTCSRGARLPGRRGLAGGALDSRPAIHPDN